MSQEDTIHPDALELASLLTPSWPQIRVDLHRRPILICDEETEEEKKAREEEEKKKREEEEAKNATPPWGDDKDFDPERAWKLIQNLRGERDTLKSERDEARGKVQEFEEASKTEEQKRDEAAAAATKEGAEAKAEAARLRVALKKGLDETQAKRLVGETEEDLEKDADELLASFKGGDDDDGDDPPPRRPKERMRTGAARRETPDETDPAKLADAVPTGY